MSKEPRLAVSEIFGPTIQGEGRHMGQIAMFLRLAGCNLNCWWCDTPYTWAFGARAVKHQLGRAWNLSEEMALMNVTDVRRELLSKAGSRFTRLIITGGEPMLQADNIAKLLGRPDESKESLALSNNSLDDLFTGIDVETAGTIAPISFSAFPEGIDIYYTVSPKLSSSRNSLADRYVPDVLYQYVELAMMGLADFKFVVSTVQDQIELLELVKNLSIPRENIWVMPEGMTRDETIDRLPLVVDFALDYGFNVSSRLHVLVWDTKRGV